MGIRFRKSIKLGGARINISKSGIGYSVGTKGARITKTANGRTRTTASIPGTGISYVKETSSKSKKTATNSAVINKPSKGIGVFCRIVSIPLILLGLLLALAVHPICWVFVAMGVIFWLIGSSQIKAYKEWKKNNEVGM